MIYDIITKKYNKKIYLLEKRYDKKYATNGMTPEKTIQLNELFEKAENKAIRKQINACKRVFALQRIFKKGD